MRKGVLIAWVVAALGCKVRQPIHPIRTDREVFYLYQDGQKGNLPLAYLPRPFYLQIIVPDTGSHIRVVSEMDSVAFTLLPGQRYRFQVLHQKGDTLQASIKGVKRVPPARFTSDYVQTHKGRNYVEVPPVYELVNILIALTPTGLDNDNLVYKESPYYREVIEHFAPYKDHPIVGAINSMLAIGRYSFIKMDSYAYVFKGDRIVNGGIYDRVSWGDYNTLDEYIPMIEDFARKSGFVDFYRQHQVLYDHYIGLFTQHIELSRMKVWLERNFPALPYDSYKVIFSPLVYANQSARHFVQSGFAEAQAHINFPYGLEKADTANPIAVLPYGDLVFTELNHSYINPVTEKHITSIANAFQPLGQWIDRSKAAGDYNDAASAFNEYMNWALVTLYYSDRVSEKELQTLKAAVEKRMLNRGFTQFAAFNSELLRLYQASKKPASELYASIISWVASQRRK